MFVLYVKPKDTLEMFSSMEVEEYANKQQVKDVIYSWSLLTTIDYRLEKYDKEGDLIASTKWKRVKERDRDLQF